MSTEVYERKSFTEERRRNISKAMMGKKSPKKGLTYKEQYGVERAKEIKKKKSLSMKDKKHSEETKRKIGLANKEANKGQIPWNKGLKNSYSKETIQKMSLACKKWHKSHPDFISGKNHPMYGTHWSEERRKKFIKRMQGENNPNYGKKFSEEHKRKIGQRYYPKGKSHPNFGKKTFFNKGAYYKGIWMRSSWEINVAKWLDKKGWKWRYEFKRFKLKDRTYVPDFYLLERDIWWEVKGWFTKRAQETIRQFRELYPEENLLVLSELIYKVIILKGGKKK